MIPVCQIMKRKFKQLRGSTILPITTKLTITPHMKPLYRKTPQLLTLEIQILTDDRHRRVAVLNWEMTPSDIYLALQLQY